MSNLKKIIDQELDLVIPNGYYNKMRANVMATIEAPKKSFQLSFEEKKDNIILFFSILFFIAIIYFFGYSKQFKISISIPKELISNFLNCTIACFVILIFLLNDYFDRKKKLFI